MLYDKRWEPKIPATTPPKQQPWQKVLLDAADLIEEKGWIRGYYHRRN